MLIYRTVRPLDLEGLYKLAIDYCKDNEIDYKLEDVKRYVKQQLQFLHLIAIDHDEKEQKVVGAISYFVLNNPYNNEQKIARKSTLFVDKEYRGSGVGLHLIREAEKIAKENGATKFFLSSPKTVKGYKEYEIDQVKEL